MSSTTETTASWRAKSDLPSLLLSPTGLPSLTMKATFSAALLVLAISAWTSFAVGELQVLALSTFSAIDLTYGKISGASAM